MKLRQRIKCVRSFDFLKFNLPASENNFGKFRSCLLSLFFIHKLLVNRIAYVNREMLDNTTKLFSRMNLLFFRSVKVFYFICAKKNKIFCLLNIPSKLSIGRYVVRRPFASALTKRITQSKNKIRRIILWQI